MPAKPQISDEQWDVLLKFMLERPAMARGSVGNDSPLVKRQSAEMWAKLASILNAVGTGAIRTPQKWRDYWCQAKYAARKKASVRRQQVSGNGVGPVPKKLLWLTEREQLILATVGQVAGRGEEGFHVPLNENQNAFNQKTEMEIEYDNSEELEYKAVEMGTTVSSDEEDPLDALETNAEHLTETNEKSSQERAQTPQSVASEVSEVNATELPQPRKRLRAEYEDVARRQRNKLEAELELIKVRVEIAEREKYKLDLELLKLERELNITHHPTFTLPIVTRSIKNEHSTG